VAGLTSGKSSALPAVGLVLAGAFRLLPALNQILFLTNQVQYNSPATELVAQELETYDAFKPPATATTAPAPVDHELRLDDVSFRYPGRPDYALRHVSVAIEPGESIGILGPTGSGKSTLLDLMLGVLVPDQGAITVDDMPLALRRESWQRAI